MSTLEDRVRDALHGLAPAEPSTQGLVPGALRHHARTRRLRFAGAIVVAAAVLAGLAMAVASLNPPPRVVHANPMAPSPGSCTAAARPASPPATAEAPSSSVVAAWICPDLSGSTSGDGWELPTAPLTGSRTEDILAWLQAAGDPAMTPDTAAFESYCGPVRPGPDFTISLQSSAQTTTTYRSVDLECEGAHLLARFHEALAGQQADARAATAPADELACRSTRAWTDSSHTTALDSPLVTARLCFAPRYFTGDPTYLLQPMLARSYQSTLLPPQTLALLSQDMTAAPQTFYTGNGACTGEGSWTYMVVGKTQSGQNLALATSCLDELWVVGINRRGFNPSPATTAALRALVPPG